MKLIFLYGPPGVGKLTVAKELSKITGYDLFHNHLTVDLAASIFPHGTDEFDALVEKLRVDLLDAASKTDKVELIFTFVYGVGSGGDRDDDRFVKRILDLINTNHGQVLFVKLTCSERELHHRLSEPSRKQFRKIQSVEHLQRVKEDYNLDETIPFGDSFLIDNTEKSPARVAEAIKIRYEL